MRSPRTPRLALVVVAIAATIMGVVIIRTTLEDPSIVGMDYRVYLERTQDWLAGNGFYLPRQLAGPYPIEHGDALYPPLILYLTVPFAVVLPALLWWAVPIAGFAWALNSRRPGPWGWVILVALLLYPRTWAILIHGNPSLWVMAALALGGWRTAFALIKPTFVPFALIGARDRRWWVVVAVGLAAAVPFGLAMWMDYATALRGAQTSNLGYLWVNSRSL